MNLPNDVPRLMTRAQPASVFRRLQSHHRSALLHLQDAPNTGRPVFEVHSGGSAKEFKSAIERIGLPSANLPTVHLMSGEALWLSVERRPNYRQRVTTTLSYGPDFKTLTSTLIFKQQWI